MKRRFYGHRSTVNTHKLDTPVGHHFNLPNHSIFDMNLQGIEALGNSRETVRLSRGKGEGKDKGLLVISFLDVQTMGLNGLYAPYPQFLPTQTDSLSGVTQCLNAL